MNRCWLLVSAQVDEFFTVYRGHAGMSLDEDRSVFAALGAKTVRRTRPAASHSQRCLPVERLSPSSRPLIDLQRSRSGLRRHWRR